MNIFGLELTGEHARLVGTVIGALLTAGGFLAGRWSHLVLTRRIAHEDLVALTLIAEFYGHLPAGTDDIVDRLIGSSAMSLDDFFKNEALVQKIRRAARKHPGLLQLEDPAAHRLMMDEGANWLRGLDPAASIDFLLGRPTDSHVMLIAFASYPVEKAARGQLHAEIDRLRLIVMSRDLAERTLAAGPPAEPTERHTKRLYEIATAWRMQGAAPDPGSDLVWAVELRTRIG